MSKSVMPFREPKFTMFSNDALDYVMREVSPNCWKIICVAVRKTRGWHKQTDVISYSQFQKYTGIVSRSTIHNSINEAVNKGILLQNKKGKSFEYQLNRKYVQKIDQSNNCTDTSTDSGTDTSTDSGHTKESIKEKKDITNPQKQTTEEIIAELEKHQEMAKERSGKNPRAKQVLEAMAGGEKQQLDIKSAFAEHLGLTPPWNYKSNRKHYQFFRKEAENGRHVQQFAEWWYKEDWRGKDGQSPSMNQVRTMWLQAFQNKPDVIPQGDYRKAK